MSKAMSLRLRVSSMTDMSQGNDSSATQNNPEVNIPSPNFLTVNLGMFLYMVLTNMKWWL